MNSHTDHELIVLISAGNEQALEQLMVRYSAQLSEFAFDYVKSPDVAQDVVAGLFVWLWEHRSGLRFKTSVRGYLFGAVRNRALNVLRSERLRNSWLSRNASNPAAAGVGQIADPEAISEREDLAIALRNAISTLAETRREVVTLRWIRGLSYAEIAEVTGTTVVGVKQQLNRALKDLRARLPNHFKEG